MSRDPVMNIMGEDSYRGAIKGTGKGQISTGWVQGYCQNKNMLCPLQYSAMRRPCSSSHLARFGLRFACYKATYKTVCLQSVQCRRALWLARSTPEADGIFFWHRT